MDDLSARCPDCGFKHETEFAPCPACGRSAKSDWWCGACDAWCPRGVCPACAGLLVTPPEVVLGSAPPGARVPFRFSVRNAGKKPLDVPLSAGPAVALAARRLVLRAGAEAAVLGVVGIDTAPTGRQLCPVRFGTPVPVETTLVVEVVPPVERLTFAPPELVFPGVTPGKLARRRLTVRNAGNVPVVATVAASEPWASVAPGKVELAPGELATVKVSARTRGTDHGTRAAVVRVAGTNGGVWEAAVRVCLPEPELAAERVEFGEVRPGRPTVRTVALRNVGQVRVACRLAADQPWLKVVPGKVTLSTGKECVLKLRALYAGEDAGPHTAAVVVSFAGGQLLRIPVAAVCRVPRPVLAPVRRQTLGAVANDLPVVRRFRVTNTGDGQLDCTVTADRPWAEVLTGRFQVGAGKYRRAELKLNTPGMALGTHVATVRVRTTGGDQDVPLSLTVVEPEPELEVLGDADLGTAADDRIARGHLAVRNAGVGMLALRAVPEDARVTVTPAELRLAPGPPARLAVAVAVAGLAGGPHTFTVRFEGNGGSDRARVRCRVPVERIDAPSLIDLGDRPAGRPAGEALRVRNTGPDPVALRVRGTDGWLRPAVEQLLVRPGELVAVPFRVDVPTAADGPITTTVWLEGRTIRHAVGVRVVPRAIDLVVVPQTVALGNMAPGEERSITFQVVNRGELPAHVHECHTRGDLEVWVRRKTVKPGTTAVLAGRVKVNAGGVGAQLQAVVMLAEQVSVRFTATVARPLLPRIIAGVAGLGGLAVGAAVGAAVGWVVGVLLMVAGLIAAGVILVRTERV